MYIRILNYKKLGLKEKDLTRGSQAIRDYVDKSLDNPIDEKLSLVLSTLENLVFIDKDDIRMMYYEYFTEPEPDLEWSDWYDTYAENFATSIFQTLGFTDKNTRYFESVIDYAWEIYEESKK